MHDLIDCPLFIEPVMFLIPRVNAPESETFLLHTPRTTILYYRARHFQPVRSCFNPLSSSLPYVGLLRLPFYDCQEYPMKLDNPKTIAFNALLNKYTYWYCFFLILLLKTYVTK